MRNRIKWVTLALALSASAVGAQSVEAVLKSALDASDKRMTTVQNVTLVQAMSGFMMMDGMELTSYMEKEMVDGHAKLVTRKVSGMGQEMDASDGVSELSSMEVLTDTLFIRRARHAGMDNVNGKSCHRVAVDDLTGIDFQGPMSPGAGEMKAGKVEMCLDATDFVPLRMLVEGEIETQGRTASVKGEITMTSYVNEGGFLYPRSTSIKLSGLEALMSDQERAQIAAARAQLAQMPPEQRAMMEQMMGGMLQMMNSGVVEMSLETKSVKVNAGPPGQD